MPSTAQPAPETDEKKSRGLGSYVGRCVFWAFVAFVVYVLGSGPATSYIDKHNTSAASHLYLLFRPLYNAYGSHSLLHKPLGLYWHMWSPEYIGKNGDEL